ncbi:precorrin-2 C(20)-methyltransferase [Marinomonas posidonica]|uniref:Precorrin-2 C20-methyltransferase n=1 Tax=Marinomonas posidonica (strain CECT 7376 / NCIMB 14433 / IVIA-Po-181) TaxID=491952 RepID=F6CSU2_MARPP|nr:precorrin-2 C(20)-methyltransferase [Marinomonas posidonica]AEF53932.1 precorrin-2 C20-methyltransferase [Marinomonas posidonica IVIA-Po-181]
MTSNNFSVVKAENRQKDGLKGRFIGVGVGPGDPELITLKALRLIQRASVVSYLANDQGASQAKSIASEAFANVSQEQDEIAIHMPMSTDRALANQAYDLGTKDITKALEQGLDVVFLCEGDPLFFGSFAYLLERIAPFYECQVVPGVSSINAASSALNHPLTVLKESFAVVSGRHSAEQIDTALAQHDTVVIMKAGRARPRILAALRKTQRLHEAKYLEYIGRDNERILHDVSELEDKAGPYFSLFVVTRTERGTN